jgi:hypothetical protein
MRPPVSGDLFVSLAAFSIPAKSPFSVIFKRSPFGSSEIASINARIASTASCAALLALQGKREAADLLAIDVSHSGMQELRHLRCVGGRTRPRSLLHCC